MDVEDTERNPTLDAAVAGGQDQYQQQEKVRRTHDDGRCLVQLIVVEERQQDHAGNTDKDKEDLTLEEIEAVILRIKRKGVACRKHHDRADDQQYQNNDAKRQVDPHADIKPFCVFFAPTDRTDKKAFSLLFVVRLFLLAHLFVIKTIHVGAKKHFVFG